MAYGIAFTQAIYVLTFIADKIRQGHFDFVPMSLISETLNIPRPSIVKILQALSQIGLVETGSGVHGGIRLLRNPSEITFETVFRAIEGEKPLFRMDHTLNAVGARPELAKQGLDQILKGLDINLRSQLQNFTISNLLDNMTSL